MIHLMGKRMIPIQLDVEDYESFFTEGFNFYVGTDSYVYRRKYIGRINGKDINDRISLHRFITKAPKSYMVNLHI